VKTLLSITAAFTLGVSQGSAQLIRDDFSTDGSLTGSVPDIGSAWTTISGTPAQLQVISGRVRLTSAGDEDVQSTFAAQSGITLFAGFTLNYSVPPSSSGSLTLSFRSAEGYIGRIFLGQSTANTFRIGIDNNLDNPVYWPSPLNISTDYRIVLGFTENGSSDRTTLWVSPTAINDPSVSEPTEAVTTAVTGFSFRQGGFSGDLAVDDLYVGTDFSAATVPEPSTFLFLVGALGFLSLRRNRTGPNHALQRTAPHVTAAASGLRLSATVQPPRRAPRSLSLGSLGD
jgi:hypothetical protein